MIDEIYVIILLALSIGLLVYVIINESNRKEADMQLDALLKYLSVKRKLR